MTRTIMTGMDSRTGLLLRNLSICCRQVLRALGLPLALVIMLAGCAGPAGQPPVATATPAPVPEAAPAEDFTGLGASGYDADSWRKLIPADCKRYSDGCNLCNRNLDSGMTACTRKACVAYEQPLCLDENAEAAEPAAHNTFVYRCRDDYRFAVTVGEYLAGDQRVQLREDQVLLTDLQSGTAALLTRAASAAGARYRNDELEFWSKGGDAVLLRGGEPLYWNCVHP